MSCWFTYRRGDPVHLLRAQEQSVPFGVSIPNSTLDPTAAFLPSHQMFQARPEAGQRFKIPAIEKAVAERLIEKTERLVGN